MLVGAGQSGLNVGARFRQMNIPTLIIHRDDAVGDGWRKRYPSLTLHTPNTHHSCGWIDTVTENINSRIVTTVLYTRFPTNAPKFTPRDKVVSMLEQYAQNQDLIIWNRSTVIPTPSYNPLTKRWTVNILRDGAMVTLYPHHIVLAIGLGKPYFPLLPGMEKFKGVALHANNFKAGSSFSGKNTIVIGASQTAADTCQQLAICGAASITMVQRSSTIVVSMDYTMGKLKAFWPMHSDPSIGDFKLAGMPLGLLKQIEIGEKENRVAQQKEMLDGLLKAGLNIDEGSEGGGQITAIYERSGGKSYLLIPKSLTIIFLLRILYDSRLLFKSGILLTFALGIDIGTADLIIKGRVKIKSGTQPDHFVSDGVVFKDGSSLKADLVVFATGYEPVKDNVRGIFGEELATKVTPIWNMDEEGECRRTYTPSGQPGVSLAMCAPMTKVTEYNFF